MAAIRICPLAATKKIPSSEVLQEAAERQHAVAAALASVRAEGLEPGTEDLALFAEVAAGRLSTDELRSGCCPATAGEQRGR